MSAIDWQRVPLAVAIVAERCAALGARLTAISAYKWTDCTCGCPRVRVIARGPDHLSAIEEQCSPERVGLRRVSHGNEWEWEPPYGEPDACTCLPF